MPQQDGWITLGPTPDINEGWITLGQQEVDKPWYEDVADQFTVGNAIRLGGSALGAIGGGLAGGPAGLYGGLIGGGMAGEAGGRWWEGKDFDPTITLTEGLLNTLPGGGAIPGKGAALSAIGKYALRNAGHGVWQGAVGALPRHQAEAGNLWDYNKWEMPSAGEIGGQAIAGGAIGGVLGGGLGAANVSYRNNLDAGGPPSLGRIIPPPNPPRPPTFGQDTPAYVQGPEIGPYGTGQGQGQLPLGQDFPLNDPIQRTLFPGRPAPTRAETLDDIESRYPYQPEVPPAPEWQPSMDLNAGNLFNTAGPPQGISQTPFTPPPPAPPAPPSVDVTAPPQGGLDPIVTIQYPNSAEANMLIMQGYKHVPNSNPIQMALPHAMPQAIAAVQAANQPPPPTPQPPAAVRPELPNAINTGEIAAGTVQEIPNEYLSRPGYLANLKAGGWVQISKGPLVSTFKRLLTEAEGIYTPKEMWENLKRLLGREPNIDELDAAMGRQKSDAERGGLVADFALPQEPPGTPPELQGTLDKLRGVIDRNNPPSWDQIDQTANQIPWEGPDPTAGSDTWGPPETPRLHPLMSQRIEEAAPTGVPWDLTPQSVPEQGMFPMEMRGQNQLRNITEQGMTREPPVQPSMIDNLVDDEINAYLKAEDATPPEMRDLSTYGPEGMYPPPSDEPQFARIPGKGLTASVNITRAVENITRDYTSPLPGIMKREGVQNALDAADKLGTAGEVKVRIKGDTLEIYDNGAGLDENQLANKLVEIFATGKEGEAGATGGKGIGSASYIYGGQHFEITTVAVDQIDGRKYKITAGGTPQQFLDPVVGSDWDKHSVNPHTPTGTRIKVTLKSDQNPTYASDMIEKIVRHSRNRQSRIVMDPYGADMGPISKLEPDPSIGVTEHRIPPSSGDKMIGDFVSTNRNSEIKVLIPNDPRAARDGYDVHYLNNGMYQFSEHVSLSEKGDGVPERVIVDIHPLVDDQDDLYPFINTREDIKKDIREEVTKYINTNISAPAMSKRKNRVQELYDSMSQVPVSGTTRKPVIYDPGTRLTPQEMESITRSPVVQQLIRTYDSIINDIILATGRQAWDNRLEGVGIVFDPGMHGVHIPNPTTKKSTILLNPFIRIDNLPPQEAAWNGIITNLHEVAHIGTEHSTPIRLTPQDLQDPRVGEFLANYMNQLVDHGDLSMWRDTGHGMTFAHRLGEVFAKYGVQRTFDAAAAIQSAITGTRSGIFGQQPRGYSPEIQRVLQLYKDSRGRPAVTEDLLSPTGIKQSDRGSSGEGGVPGDTQAAGDGTSLINRFLSEEKGSHDPLRDVQDAWKWAKNKTGIGMGTRPDPPPPPPGTPKPDPTVAFVTEALQFPTNATTTLDYSFPGRQGLPLVATPQFWNAAGKMFKGGLSDKAFDILYADLMNKPIMQDKLDLATGKTIPSVGKQIGIKIFLPASRNIGPRAEGIASRWLETGAFLGGEKLPFTRTVDPVTGKKVGGITNPLAATWKHTIGRPIRATNRASLTFLNELNVNRTEYLMNKARDMSIEAIDTGKARMPGILGGVDLPQWMGGGNIGFKRKYSTEEAMDLNPYHNIPLAKDIAEFTNAATGHATAKMGIANSGLSLENAVSKIGFALFSPSLLNSRIRLLNPTTYVMATPYVRRQYAKAALSAFAAWGAVTTMAKMAGAEVGEDPTSADRGKIIIGDTRIDPGGGFLQFWTLYNRLLEGGYTSSATGEYHKFGEGFHAETRRSAIQRFGVNKLNPLVRFAYDVMDASQYQPFHVYDRTAQLFTSLFVQDVIGIVKDRPDLIPWLVPMFFGMGTQTYSKGESIGKIVPPDSDWLYEGGGNAFEMLPEGYVHPRMDY